MTAPKSDVDITGEQLFEILTSFENLALDYYVMMRRRYELDHEQTKRLMAVPHMGIDYYQQACDAGLSFNQMEELVEQGFIIRNVVHLMKHAGATFEEAKEAQAARALVRDFREYIDLRVKHKVGHDEIMIVVRAANEAGRDIDHVLQLVFYNKIALKHAIEVAEHFIWVIDYPWMIAGGSSHKKAMAYLRSKS